MRAPDFDLAEWDTLPPLCDADLPAAPPPERDCVGGIVIGSDLAWTGPDSLAPAGSGSTAGVPLVETATDLGRAVYENWATVQPGLVEIARLGSTDFSALDSVQRVDALLALESQQAWLEAHKQRVLALISSRDSSAKHWCVEEVGAALRLSGAAARTKLANAEQLAQRLPHTLAALSAGELSTAQATAITEKSFELDDELLPAFENRVLRNAPWQSVTELKRTATRAALSLDPTAAERKRDRASSNRQVRVAPAEHGMAWLMALLPGADAHAMYAKLDGAARMAPAEDSRTLDQLRADALVNAILNGIDGDLPTEQGRRPGINVTVALTTLTGQDEEPAWLDGYGPISAGHAREIAHDPTGTWRRLITDPMSGQLLDYGRTRYRPPRHLADHVIARDGACTFPFCSHNARRADLDHITPYPYGPTSAENLQPLHRRHHNAKTEAGWQCTRDPATGDTTWTSPQGRSYRTRPAERWTLPTPDPNEPPPF